MHLLLRHKLAIAAATLVAAGSAGIAYAATQSSSNPRQAFLNDVAKRLNVSPAQLRSALKGALIDRLNAEVKAGQLTQAQANRIEQRLQQLGTRPMWLGPGARLGLLGPGARLGLRVRGGGFGPLGDAARYLGLSDIQLVNDLRSGKSMAQVAKAQGKSVSGLEQAIISGEKARLDRLVANGIISRAQEQRISNALARHVGKLVNRTAFPRLVDGGPGPWPMSPGPVPQNAPKLVPPVGAPGAVGFGPPPAE